MAEFENVTHLTVQQLYDMQGEKLGLEWVAGQHGGKHIIVSELFKPREDSEDSGKSDGAPDNKNEPEAGQSFVGYLNLIHPHQIQVLGQVELKYIEDLQDNSRQDAMRQLFKHNPAIIIVSDSNAVPVFLKRKCNENSTPLFSSTLPSHKLHDDLHYYLSNLFAQVIIMPGVFMEVSAIGVLITGASSIGKSELALELVSRGHRLVADDAPHFFRIAPDIISGYCPEILQDFLEVRGIGIINVRELFGDGAIKRSKYLRLIVRLVTMDSDLLAKLDRLEGSYGSCRIFDIEIPEISIPVTPGRNLAVLVECAARNHMLRYSGHNAAEQFSERQKLFIGRGEK